MQNFFLNSKWNCKIENHCFNVKLLPWAHFLNLFYLTVLTKNLQILICIWLYLEFDAPYLPYHFNCSRLLILYIVAHEESLFSFYRNEYFWEVNYIYCVRSPCVKLFNPFVNRCCIYKHDFIIIICGQLDFESSFTVNASLDVKATSTTISFSFIGPLYVFNIILRNGSWFLAWLLTIKSGLILNFAANVQK